jgi:type I restriction enzyme S subunit
MREWKPYKLDEISTKLGDGLHGTPEYDDAGEYYFINGSNLVNGKIVINSNTKRVAKEEYNKYKKDLSDRTILLGINGTIGNVALFNNEKCILGKSACYINVDTKFDKQFIKYILLSDGFQNYIKTNATGTTIKNVGLKLIREYEAVIPLDIQEQQQIASILSSLDNKIELNLQMNQTLETMAQAIFREWFVNFNFPGFDGELLDGLPKGWNVGSILEIATLLSGGTPKTDVAEYWNGTINWISAKDITSSNKKFIIETEKTITELGIQKSAAKILPKFTTIISARGTVGNYCILSKEMAISQSNYGLKSKFDFDYFLFLMIETMIMMMKAFSYGTVFDTITTKTFQEMEVTIPTNKVIEEFEKVITPLYEKILTNQFQIQSLTQIRDSLLPKLMTGKIEIKNNQ